jgi:nucleolar complex protein 3
MLFYQPVIFRSQQRNFDMVDRPRKKAKLVDPQENVHENDKSAKKSIDDSYEYMSFEEKCDFIAEISESILEDPSNAFVSSSQSSTSMIAGGDSSTSNRRSGLSRMHKLLNMADIEHEHSDIMTARVAIISLVSIFSDILPLQRIRLPTAAERNVRVSKETKKLWDYEQRLLQSYQKFLKLLQQTWQNSSVPNNKSNKSHQTLDPLAITAILSQCQLLQKAFHFNFCNDLLTSVVKHMNHPSSEIQDACCSAIEYVLANDVQGDMALETVRKVCQRMRQKNFHAISPRILQTLTSIPLRVHWDEAQAAAKLSAAVNKRNKKINKNKSKDEDKNSEENIDAELREGEGRVNKLLLARNQSEALQAITVTYFQILKSDPTNRHIVALLPVALEGLAKIVHLINMDTVQDLLQNVKQMLKQTENLSFESSLGCILCAFSTLQGPGKELQVDPKEYLLPLFAQLSRSIPGKSFNSIEIKNEHQNSKTAIDMLLKCLTAAILNRREYSVIRLASFAKRIATASLHNFSPASSIVLLAFLRQMLLKYPQSLEPLLESEIEGITEGQYDPFAEDPEFANPMATSLWELSLLHYHIHPWVSNQANKAAQISSNNLANVLLPSETPQKLSSYFHQMNDFVIDAIPIPTKNHPLTTRRREKSMDANMTCRFITPNVTGTLFNLE